MCKRIIVACILFFVTAAQAEININTATVEEIDQSLVGVGKAKAEAIVQDREKNGPFTSVEDLDRVKGIGPGIIQKNAGQITVGSPDSKPSNAGTATKNIETSNPTNAVSTVRKTTVPTGEK